MSRHKQAPTEIALVLDILKILKQDNPALFLEMRPHLPGFAKALNNAAQVVDADLLHSHIDQGVAHIIETRKTLDQNRQQNHASKPKSYHNIKNSIYDKTVEALLGGEPLSLAIRANDLTQAQDILNTHDDINHHCDILQHCLKDCSVEMFSAIANKYETESWLKLTQTANFRHDDHIFNAAIKLKNPALFEYVYENYNEHLEPITRLFFNKLDGGDTKSCVAILQNHGDKILPDYSDVILLYAAAYMHEDLLSYFEEADISCSLEPDYTIKDLKDAPLTRALHQSNMTPSMAPYYLEEEAANPVALYQIGLEYSIETNDKKAIESYLLKTADPEANNFSYDKLADQFKKHTSKLSIENLSLLINYYKLDMSGGNNCIFSMDKETKKPDLELIAKCIGATGDSDKINWFLTPDNFPYLEEKLSKTEWCRAFIQPLAKASAEQSHIDLFKSLKVSKEDHLKECLIKACTHEQTAIINHIVKAEPDFLKKSETVHAALEANGCIQVFFDNYNYSEAAKHQLLDYALDHGSLASCQYLAAQVQNINAVDQTTIATLCALTADQHLNYNDGKQKPSARKLYSLVENGLDLESLPEEFRPKYQKYAEWINMHGSTVEDIPLHLTEYSPHYFKPKAYEFVKKQLGFEHSISDLTARENMAYQISALFQTEDRILSYMEKWGKLGYTLHDISQMIAIPAQGQFNAKSWGDAALKQGPRMANLLRFADRMSEPLRNDAGTTWSYKNTLDAIGGDLYSRAKEHTKLAELCANCLYTEADFEKTLKFWAQYQELYKDSDYQKPSQSIPTIEIDGAEFGKAGYLFRKLDDGDVRGLLLGAFTECCQHIANPHGHSCAEHGFIKETSGFYVIEDKDTNQIIGQSWAWRGKKDELTLDSLEFINGTLNAQNWQSLCTIFTQKIAECDELNNISAVHIGCGGKTPALSFDHATKSTLASPKEPCAYSDAKGNQYRIGIPRKAL